MGSPLVVDCPSCGQTLRYPGPAAQSKTVKCPACSIRFQIAPHSPEPEPDSLDPSPTPRRTPRRGPARKPARKKRTQSAVQFDRRWILGGIAILAVVAATVLWNRVAPSIRKAAAAVADVSRLNIDSDSNAGMTWLSDFTQTLCRIRVSRLINSPGWKAMPQSAKCESQLNQLTAEVGLKLEEIDSFTLGATGLVISQKPGPNNVVVVVIRLAQPLQPEQWKRRIIDGGHGTIEEQRFQGETICVLARPQGTDAFFFVDPKTIVSSRLDYLQRAIPKRGRCAAESRFEGLSQGAALEIALAPQVVEMNYDYFRGVAPDRKPLMVAVQADLQTDLKIQTLARMATPQLASDAQSKVDVFKSTVQSAWNLYSNGRVTQQGPQSEAVGRFGSAFVESVQNATASVEGSTFKLDFGLPASALADLAIASSDSTGSASLLAVVRETASGQMGGSPVAIGRSKSIATTTKEFSPIAGSDWKLLSLPEFSVSVETPDMMPLVENVTGPGSFRLRTYTLVRPHDSFEVFVTLFPEEIRAKMKHTGRPLEYYLDFMAKADETRIGADQAARILSRQDLRLGPHLGREATSQSGRRFKTVRNYISGEARWVVEYQYDEGHEAADDRDRFFNSLKLIQ